MDNESTGGENMEQKQDFILGMDWGKLPEELKEKTITVRKAFLRVTRATKQHALWRREMELAQRELTAARDSHSDVLNRWNPDTNVLDPLIEADERSA